MHVVRQNILGMRYLSAAASKAVPYPSGSQRAWQLHDYGGPEAMRLADDLPMPRIQRPSDVLVKVHAASMNRLDVWMSRGYGWALFNALRAARQGELYLCSEVHELPLTLGRDFSGVVVDKGRDVDWCRLGDAVWGTTFPAAQAGSHAEHLVTSKYEASVKPSSLTHVEAAAIPYAGMTAMSALTVFGDMLTRESRTGRNVLLLGASGGVGHLALQILKYWGNRVVAVCSKDSQELAAEFGADVCLDYRDPQYKGLLTLESRRGFDLILDCSGNDDTSCTRLLRPWNGARYITLSSPLLREMNRRGLLYGAVTSLSSLLSTNLSLYSSRGVTHRWAYYSPVPSGLEQLKQMVDEGKLRPHVNKVYSFEEANKAYVNVDGGHQRGKVVIEVNK